MPALVQGINDRVLAIGYADYDNDGVLDEVDLCAGTRVPFGTVSYASCDCCVADFLLTEELGCSVSQQIERLAIGAKSKGQLVSRVDKLLASLQKQGLLRSQDKGPIKVCVAQKWKRLMKVKSRSD